MRCSGATLTGFGYPLGLSTAHRAHRYSLFVGIRRFPAVAKTQRVQICFCPEWENMDAMTLLYGRYSVSKISAPAPAGEVLRSLLESAACRGKPLANRTVACLSHSAGLKRRSPRSLEQYVMYWTGAVAT